MLNFFPGYMEGGRKAKAQFTLKKLRSMAEARVREVLCVLNVFPEINYQVALLNGLRDLWAEWIELGVPEDLLCRFSYTFDLVEYVDHSTFSSKDEWRDLVIEATIVVSIDGPAADPYEALACHANQRRTVLVAPARDVPRGNGRYIWIR